MTAFRWLVRHRNPRLGTVRASRARSVPARAPSAQEARSIRALLDREGPTVDAPFDVLVSTASGRRTSSLVRPHLCSEPLPPGSLVPLFEQPGLRVLVAAPELTFPQIASRRPLEETAYLGCALCSSYRIDPTARGGIEQRERGDGPLTARARLASYLDRASGLPGLARARAALAFVLDGARSPMESGIALSLSMPLRHGGFNLGDIRLNAPLNIDIGRGADGARRRQTRYPDLLISAKGNAGRAGERARVGVDYDGLPFHRTRHALARDAARRNEIAQIAGFTHLTVTADQVLDFNAYLQLAEQIRRALGLRAQPRLQQARTAPESARCLSEVRHRQFQLWATLVCPSEFRREE